MQYEYFCSPCCKFHIDLHSGEYQHLFSTHLDQDYIDMTYTSTLYNIIIHTLSTGLDFAATDFKSSIAALATTAEPDLVVLGAKAVAEPKRRVRIESFMLDIVFSCDTVVICVRISKNRGKEHEKKQRKQQYYPRYLK